MKTSLYLAAATALLTAMSAVHADEKTVTKTIELDLGQTPTISSSSGPNSTPYSITPGQNGDGTRSLPDSPLGGVYFSATGAASCEMELSSDYVDGNGKFLLASSASDLTNSITYDVTGSVPPMSGKAGTGLIGGNAAGTVTTAVTVNTNGWKSSIEDSDNGACGIIFNSPTATNFKTNDAAASAAIPADWSGTRTGNVIFTMRAL